MIDELLAGDRRALARTITTLESTNPKDRTRAEEMLEALLPHTGGSLRVGITGTPGVGKSTFINALGRRLLERDHRLAVLTIDPSSRSTGGSILGDKTRMADLASSGDAYVRPSPSGGITGGVALRTHEAVLACEAAGFDTVLIETVGVGQSETAVENVSDVFLLLVGPGGGDDLQGIKRGIMELADVVAVNKADGDQQNLAKATAGQYASALSLVRPKSGRGPAPVLTCSSLAGDGIDNVWETVKALHGDMAHSGELRSKRRRQSIGHFESEIQRLLMARATQNNAFRQLHVTLADAVGDGQRSAAGAARQLLETHPG